MSSIINFLLPVFGLILAGYVCWRTGQLGETASSEINRFIVWLVPPALLCKVTYCDSVPADLLPNHLLGFGIRDLSTAAFTTGQGQDRLNTLNNCRGR